MGAGASKPRVELPKLQNPLPAIQAAGQAVTQQAAEAASQAANNATAPINNIVGTLWSDEQNLDALEQPYEKKDEGRADATSKCFYVYPHDEEFKKKSPKMVLEISSLGFRLLRPETEAPLGLYSWGQIHSWAHAPNDFAFRHFDEGRGTILRHSFAARDVDQMLVQIQFVIDGILTERKRLAVSPEAFTAIMQQLEATDPSQRVDLLAKLVKDHYFFSSQGTEVMRTLPTTFEKVDAAVLLHGRLVDQTSFSQMLENADCQGDKDNIWHRITSLRKANSIARGDRGDKRAPR
uniref:DUF4476 domain-containing protein n=1 Tax=Dunaliella tertiolecta TaxID=3047 RepID=A0A7S3QS32_DUNTE|mmetsp:Transcript_4501/g.12284  ORF Transcript_4501/g.12284 Transcript_4501/m.12284 type:complete len:293 (+) Transcript_4501:129-1007(+)